MAPHVEIIPPMTHIMRDMPTEPLSLKIVAGVENILCVCQYQRLTENMFGHEVPGTDDLVHNK